MLHAGLALRASNTEHRTPARGEFTGAAEFARLRWMGPPVFSSPVIAGIFRPDSDQGRLAFGSMPL
jgi:hypothetical protein